MTTAMYDAREAIIPGSVYDRSSQGKSSLGGPGPALRMLTLPTPAPHLSTETFLTTSSFSASLSEIKVLVFGSF